MGNRDNTKTDGVKIVTSIPGNGFISLVDFAEKCGVKKPAISKAKSSGKFSTSDMRWFKPQKGSMVLYLHWERAGIPYVMSRGRENYPKGFVPPEEEPHNINVESGTGNYSPQSIVKVVDLNSAKLRKEQLIIEEKEIALQKAKNELVDIDEVITIMSAVALELRQGFNSMKIRLCPVLSAEDDEHKIDSILEREFGTLANELEITLDKFINGEDAPGPEAWELEEKESK